MENTLKAFMREEYLVKEPVKYVASKRIKDDKGAAVEWQLRVLTNLSLIHI